MLVAVELTRNACAPTRLCGLVTLKIQILSANVWADYQRSSDASNIDAGYSHTIFGLLEDAAQIEVAGFREFDTRTRGFRADLRRKFFA